MQQKYPILIFLFLILVAGCSTPSGVQVDTTVTPLKEISSSASLSTSTAAPLASTSDPKFIPKQHDFIFIDFFAGT